MTHELRTPMNGMMGMAHLLLETELDRDQRGMVEVLLHAGEGLLDLVNDTLDFSRAEAGKLVLERIPFDLRVTVNEAGALLAPLANEKGLNFDCHVHHEAPSRVCGDPGRLRQVLLNLGGNAIKFTEQGRVTIAVERLEEDEKTVTLRIAVTDTGIGMTEEQRGRVFEAFEQADASIGRRFGGSGLGLAISSRLVGLMGGRMGVESESGRGSTFWFEVLLERQQGAVPAPEAVPADPELAGARVLVVEPSAMMRRSYVSKLCVRGCRVESVGDAEEALVALRAAAEADDGFRFVLVERELPGMDGEELGAAIRADALHERTLTVLVTSAGSRGDAARARARGFAAYISKPLEWDRLAAMLAEAQRRAEAAPAGTTPALVTLHSMAEAQRSRLRILLVEDSAVNQLVTQWALRRLGYGLQMAATVAAALDAWEQGAFDLVLLDLRLPDGDGYGLARELRSREAPGRRVPIVAMTGSDEPGDRDRCLEAGMDEYVTKPVDLGLLCNVVERLTHGEAGDGAADGAWVEASRRGAPDAERIEVVADDAPLLREIEAAEADICGLARDGAAGRALAGTTPPPGLGDPVAVRPEETCAEPAEAQEACAEPVEAQDAYAEPAEAQEAQEAYAEPAEAQEAQEACAEPAVAQDEPVVAQDEPVVAQDTPVEVEEAETGAAAWLVPPVETLSSADVVPLAGDPLPEDAEYGEPRPPLDLARLEQSSMGLEVLRGALLDTFLTEVRPRLEQLGQALVARDARRVEFEAHGLKGMCMTLGANACSEVFAELEQLGRERELAAAGPLVKRAHLEVMRAERCIDALRRQAA